MANDGILALKVGTTTGKPVGGPVDIEIRHQRLASERKTVTGADASRTIEISGLRTAPDGVYKLAVSARSYRPLRQFVNLRSSGRNEVDVLLEPAATGGDEKQVIDRAMHFPLDDVVARHAGDHDLPQEVVEEHARELKRYLALAAITNEPYGMRGPADELWHTFVLFTKLYAQFCDEVAGRFLHHFPTVPGAEDPERDRRQLRESYLRFLRDYEAILGESPPAHIWPRPTPGERVDYNFANCSTITGGTTATEATTEEIGGCTVGGDPELE